MKIELFDRLLVAKRQRKAVAMLTTLVTGEQRLVFRDDTEAGPELEKAFRFDKSGMMGDEFVAIHNPPLRLIIIGAVLIAQHAVATAKACGHDVHVVDPRRAFATGMRFPDVFLHADWPQDILPSLTLDERTALIALSHVPDIDDAALELAVKSEAFYIGALGSRKSHAARLERLKAKGCDEAMLGRISAPIGLPIGAVGAAEIAVSIMAEMIKALRLGLS